MRIGISPEPFSYLEKVVYAQQYGKLQVESINYIGRHEIIKGKLNTYSLVMRFSLNNKQMSLYLKLFQCSDFFSIKEICFTIIITNLLKTKGIIIHSLTY